MSEEEIADFTDIIIPAPHTCLICEKVLPNKRKIKNMFFCEYCNEWRKKFPPETTLGEMQECYKKEVKKK